jgi:hypothetical protein
LTRRCSCAVFQIFSAEICMLCRQCSVFMCFIHFACPTTFLPELTASQACVDEIFKPKRKTFIPQARPQTLKKS